MSEKHLIQELEAALERELADGLERGEELPALDAGAEAGVDTEDEQELSIQELRQEILHSVDAGLRLPQDICDDAGVLLLAAGTRVTRRFLQLLRERNIKRVCLRRAEPQPPVTDAEELAQAEAGEELHTRFTRELDEQLAEELQRPIVLNSVQPWRRPRLSIEDLKGRAVKGVKTHEITSAVVNDLCADLRAGRPVSADQLHQAVAQFVELAAVDFDLLPLIVSLQQSKDEYLYDHCVSVALLSMALASQLGLERRMVAEVGLSGVLQDIGMLRVPESIRLAARPLTDAEWAEIHRHPIYAVEMLAEVPRLSVSVKMVAYQVHERIDGHGYPRCRSVRQIHKYAQIVALADAYTAMTHPRPYRAPLSPYLAAKTILLDGTVNRYDRLLVRAFLDTVSLFPIGSQVILSDGSTARVLRANPGLHTRPVVEEVTADGCPTGHIVDLANGDTLRVVKAQ